MYIYILVKCPIRRRSGLSRSSGLKSTVCGALGLGHTSNKCPNRDQAEVQQALAQARTTLQANGKWITPQPPSMPPNAHNPRAYPGAHMADAPSSPSPLVQQVPHPQQDAPVQSNLVHTTFGAELLDEQLHGMATFAIEDQEQLFCNAVQFAPVISPTSTPTSFHYRFSVVVGHEDPEVALMDREDTRPGFSR